MPLWIGFRKWLRHKHYFVAVDDTGRVCCTPLSDNPEEMILEFWGRSIGYDQYMGEMSRQEFGLWCDVWDTRISIDYYRQHGEEPYGLPPR